MPYFKNNDVNLLFIHIPKTGGTSVEHYLSKKFDIKLNMDSLYSIRSKRDGIPYQHLDLITVITNYNTFHIDLRGLSILTVVRNPYHRIISELSFIHLIDNNTTPEQIFNHIKNIIIQYQSGVQRDGHVRPQYEMIITSNGNIPKNVIVLKTENLTEMMHELGYTNFNFKSNKSKISRDYMSYFNADSIKIINCFYRKDFEYFGYDIICPNSILQTEPNMI